MRFFRVVAGVTVAAALSWAAFANAQVGGTDNESGSDNPEARATADAELPTEIPEELFESRIMDEIKVVASQQGRIAFDPEMQRQELMQEAIYTEMRMRVQGEEESAWRQADADLKNRESRFKWGYSPQAEQRMRRDNEAMYDLPIDRVKPASIFRVEF
jgi:hypothetical protein